MKDKLTSIVKKIKPTKKQIYIALAIIVLLALFLIAMVAQVRYERTIKAQAVQEAAQQADKEAQYKNRISQLEATSKALEADKAAACSNYKALSTGRATRSLVVVPTAVHCPN